MVRRGAAIAAVWIGLAWSASAAAQDALSAAAVEASPVFSFSGEHRARFEHVDRQFRPSLGRLDRALALRTSVVVSTSWPKWSVTGELMDSRAALNDARSTVNVGIVNTVEPIQLAATRRWRNAFGSASDATLRFGRMTFDLGTRRLLARNAYRNTVNNFVGVDFTWAGQGGRAARIFHLVPMRTFPAGFDALLDDDQQLDRFARDTDFSGLHYQFRELGSGHRAELYWLELDARERNDRRDLRTIGGRIYRSPAPSRWHYEIESVAQSGTSTGTVNGEVRSGLDHDASFRHLEVGYSLAVPWAPVVSIQYDYASGDDDPSDERNERFDTLYGARRFDFGQTGIYGPFGRANLESLGVRAAFRPAQRWRTMFAYRSYALAAARDAWTTTGLRDESGRAGDALGRQLEASFDWTAIEDRLTVEAGAAYFSKGRFVREVAPELANATMYFHAGIRTTFGR